MPLEKFRSIEEMNAAPVRKTADAAFWRFRRHSSRYRRIVRTERPRGVFRFRSLQEAQAARRNG
ncbi:MAG: hypothetical protein GXY47_09045 [Acidobacteria bacterium]|nr:hypothetical protein [Acidobacteriota bacterium]